MARVLLQFRRVSMLISNIGRVNQATSGSHFEGLSTLPVSTSLEKHCQKSTSLRLLLTCNTTPSFEDPSYQLARPTVLPNVFDTGIKGLGRSPLCDPCMWNTAVIGDLVETEHVGDSSDDKTRAVYVSSVLKKRKKKMNKHKYKKRRKLDKYKRRSLENIKERKRRVKERAAARG